MARKELVDIKIIDGDTKNSKIYIMSMPISGLNTYEKAKAIRRFINNETKVLEMVLETDLREILRGYGIIPKDGSESALNLAFASLHLMGKDIEIRDRYYDIYSEKIVGESPNKMTIIQEDEILSCAMEIIINERKRPTT